MTDEHNRIVKLLRESPHKLSPASSLIGAKEILKLITSPDCECFNFGWLPLERPKERPANFVLPTVTDDELDFWAEGLLPLPAPICWYQFRVISGHESVIIVRKDAAKSIWVQRIELKYYKYKNLDLIDGMWTSANYPGQTDRRFVTYMSNDPDRFEQVKFLTTQEKTDIFGANNTLALYLTLMVQSKSTEITRVNPTATQQALRRRLGRPPLKAHSIVTIIPRSTMRAAEKEASKHSTHASPRIHWRRSHLRTICAGTPQERKIVIPRFIVGLRDRADYDESEIHRKEYRVHNLEKREGSLNGLSDH